jgi:prevent-host-death family protein
MKRTGARAVKRSTARVTKRATTVEKYEVSRKVIDLARVLSTAEARTNLSETLGRVAYGGERVLIGKRGKPMAALVPVADLEALLALEDAIDLEEVRKSLREGGKNLSHAEVLERLGLR